MKLTTKTAKKLLKFNKELSELNKFKDDLFIPFIANHDKIFLEANIKTIVNFKDELKDIIFNPYKSSDEKILDLIKMKQEIESVENETK